eukprot:NODE_391_length_8148_cov_0.393838.p5 type:complete len:223 gc:universal NODE_391_length_8148_cov_0.393838:3295-3963(+)
MMDTLHVPISNLLNFAPLKPHVKSKITQVYAWLTVAFLLAGIGYASAIPRMIAAPVAILSYLATYGPFSYNVRCAAFLTFAVTKGASLQFLEFLPQKIVLQALLYTTLIFLAFSASILKSPTRYMSYISSIISSGSLILVSNSLLSWMFNIRLGLYFELVVGIAVFAAYILYDTQVMIYKAETSQLDVLRSAADLYMDAVALLVRIALLLNEKENKKKKKSQ